MDGKLMKFKLIFAILLFPLSLMAGNTNQYSNILVNGSTITSNAFVNGYMIINSNSFVPASFQTIVVFPRAGDPNNLVDLRGGNAFQLGFRSVQDDGKTAGFDMSSGTARFYGAGGTMFTELNDVIGTVTINAPSMVFGIDSSSIETHLGITDTRPNGWLVNGYAPSTVIVTNVQANFPSILAASFSDLTFPVSNTSSNMVVSVGNPTAEDGSLSVNAFISAIGTVTLRARNVGAIAVDQADLPYRLQITVSPTANSP